MAENFRIATERDLEEIVRLFKAAIDNMRAQGIFQWDEIYPDEKILRDDISLRRMHLLTEDERIVSVFVIDDEQPEEYKSVKWEYENEKIAVIHRLCVNPEFQNKGYGRRTVHSAEREIKKMGYTAVRLDAFSQNPFALKLYESLGYIRRGEVIFRPGRFFLYEKVLL